jgi:predicted transcriptional regulator
MKRTHQYKFLVTDGDGKPTGLLSSSDIIGRVAQDKNSG